MKNHPGVRWGFLLAATVPALLLLPSCEPWCESGTQFVTPLADWLPQDYEDSRGVVSVTHARDGLVLRADMRGQDASRASGEILLDLHYYAGLESQAPIDLSGAEVKVVLWVPGLFSGPSHAPNGLQVFVKDDAWRACYSRWVNVDMGGTYVLHMHPGTGSGNIATAGFDPTRIRTIGVKLGMNSRNRHVFHGRVRVYSVCVTPALDLSPPPALPATAPAPLSAEERFELQGDGFYRGGQRWFILGGNSGLVAYGQNFGATAWFPLGNGVSKRPGFLRTNLGQAVRAGVTLIRVGLLDDGRTAFDANARVTGYSSLFRAEPAGWRRRRGRAGCAGRRRRLRLRACRCVREWRARGAASEWRPGCSR